MMLTTACFPFRLNHFPSISLSLTIFQPFKNPVRHISTDLVSDLYSRLQNHVSSSSSSPTATTTTTAYKLNKVLSLCAKWGCLFMGTQFHSLVFKLGFDSNIYICTALIDLYGKCGTIEDAHYLFDEMPVRNVVTWNSLMCCYLDLGCSETAVNLFLQMLQSGTFPTPFSFSNALAGCVQLKLVSFGRQIHGLSLKMGVCDDVVVGTGLVDMYSKCGSVDDSRKVFHLMSEKNIITWTSMIAGYSLNKQPCEAMSLLREMLHSGLRPNYVTYNCLLSSFSSFECLLCCKQVHCRIIQEGMEWNQYLAVTLVAVYSECSNSLDDFQKLCLNIRIWDQISWNALIAGFTNLGCGKEALQCFTEMRKEGTSADVFTFASTLKAVAMFSALEEGKAIHALVTKAGYASFAPVCNGLVSMYAKCGMIDDAKNVFSSIKDHDIVSWNTLLTGCAYHGFGMEAVDLFEQMRRTDIQPDNTTFLAVLTACSHNGLLNKALEYFDMMRNDKFHEPPKLEHYATMVHLLGRAGYLDEAETLINSMPIEPGISVYKALISSCQMHGNKEIAIRFGKKLQELCPDDPAAYVLLSNVLMTGQEYDDAADIRSFMSNKRVRKDPGYSWI